MLEIDRSIAVIGECPECGGWSMHYSQFVPGVVCASCGADQYAIVAETYRARSISPTSVAVLEEGLRVFGPSTDGAVERDLAAAKQREAPVERRVATDGGWIPWHGGECPIPDDVEVQVWCRDGVRPIERGGMPWRWEHIGGATDIIAYRILPEENADAATLDQGGQGEPQK